MTARLSRNDLAEIVGDIIAAKACDYGHGDIAAVHTRIIGATLIDELAKLGLAITRRRGGSTLGSADGSVDD